MRGHHTTNLRGSLAPTLVILAGSSRSEGGNNFNLTESASTCLSRFEMTTDKKLKYLSKSVVLGAKTITLFSIDGTTWSSRKDELQAIIARHEAQKASFGKLKAAQSEGDDAEKKEEEAIDDDAPVVAGDTDDEAEEESAEVPAKPSKGKAKAAPKASAKESKKSEPKKTTKPAAKAKKSK